MDFDIFEEDMGLEVVASKVKSFRIMWECGYGGSVQTSLALLNNRIYFGCADYHLYCIDANNGEELWRFRTGGVIFHSGPAVYEGRVYFGSYDSYVYCINAFNGNELWRFKTGNKLTGSMPLIFNEHVYFGSRDGNLYCLDRNGKEVWRFCAGDYVCSSPTVYDSKLIFGSHDCNLYCIDNQANELWRFRTAGCIVNTLPFLIRDGIIYFGSQDRNLYAVMLDNGKELWRFKTGNGITSIPIFFDNKIIFGSLDCNLYCITTNGKELWRFETTGRISGMKPLIVGEKIYFGSGVSEGKFYCLSLDGKKEWEFQTGSGVYSSPIIFRDMVIFGSQDCHIYALDMESGKEVWRFQTSTNVIAPVKRIEEAPYEVRFRKSENEKRGEEEGYERHVINAGQDMIYSIKSEYTRSSEYKSDSEYR
ncbi:MAG TPA: hypothetical protein ENG42_01780 [Candidatus Aenigmarchaeota archaeon]|nr:hypothetical protein [Candidatus Aenigmarchaeota archaeon]